MKNIFVKCFHPLDVVETESDVTYEIIKNYCIKAFRCSSEGAALNAYANTQCWWSTILDDSSDVAAFIEKATNAILANDYDWLEENFI